MMVVHKDFTTDTSFPTTNIIEQKKKWRPFLKDFIFSKIFWKSIVKFLRKNKIKLFELVKRKTQVTSQAKISSSLDSLFMFGY